MRLGVLEHGHRLRQRTALRLMRLTGRTEPDPVAKLSLYRPELFGRAWMHFIEAVMRGPSEWSSGERELLGAFVSRLNACPFCIGIHSELAGRHLDDSSVERLDNWREGGFDPRMTAIFELLEKVARSPEDLSRADFARVRAAGLSDTAITDALNVGFLFDTINRLANALDFGWETDADRIKLAKGLDRVRYHVPGFLLR